MKVALVHDHLAQDGGAEKVLKVFADMFPKAPIYTLLYEPANADKYYKGRQIETSIIQKLPGGVKHYQWYMPFMPMAVEFFDMRKYDLVLSDTASFAKGVITSPNTKHICYCHTPTRYLWSDTHQYITELKYNKYFKKIISLVLNYIRLWDKQAADRVDKYIANSKTVQKRISKYYRRNSYVIYPPVETDKCFLSEEIGDYFLAGCRLAPYKRIDILIEAFLIMPDKKLKIFGNGVDLKRLKKLAGNASNIEFLGRVTEEEKYKLLSRCLAFLNPQEEDFGIAPVESMASGRPVIAYNKGGAKETVIAGKTGIFFNKQNAKSVSEAINNFNSSDFDPKFIKNYAEKFSVSRFKQEIKKFIDSQIDN